MNALQPSTPRERLTIVGRLTRYAIRCTIDGVSTTISFTGRPNKFTLLRAAQDQRDAILPYLTDADKCHYTRGRLVLGARVVISVGSTERQSQE